MSIMFKRVILGTWGEKLCALLSCTHFNSSIPAVVWRDFYLYSFDWLEQKQNCFTSVSPLKNVGALKSVFARKPAAVTAMLLVSLERCWWWGRGGASQQPLLCRIRSVKLRLFRREKQKVTAPVLNIVSCSPSPSPPLLHSPEPERIPSLCPAFSSSTSRDTMLKEQRMCRWTEKASQSSSGTTRGDFCFL